MPRPLSNSALESLGRRLVATGEPDPADIDQLHLLLAAYGPVLAEAVQVVSAEVGVVPSARVKTTGTIIDKLRRNGGYTLRSIHDLGGMRFVVSGGRDEQDRAAELIRRAFVSGSRPPRIIDRRRKPVQGYRAVHVIVYPDGYPIEVQVRTGWQHRWAEWFERLADQYGRGIRYGEPPTAGGESAQAVVESMIKVADQVADAEESGQSPPLSAAVLVLADVVLELLRRRPPNP